MDNDKRLVEASLWERLVVGDLGLALMGGQFPVDGWG